jgi:hypothetical protein
MEYERGPKETMECRHEKGTKRKGKKRKKKRKK